jgi:hypothetical protein
MARHDTAVETVEPARFHVVPGPSWITT